MQKNSYLILAGIFAGLCFALCVGIWFSLTELYAYREEYDRLESEQKNNSNIIASLKTRNSSLSRIVNLSVNHAKPVPDAVVFYGMIKTMLDGHKINVLSMTASGQNDSGKKDNVLNLKLYAEYYQLMAMIADLRNLNVASKVTSLRIVRDHNLPEDLIDVDLRLEVMTGE
ncbi:MAG: hypothetical protein IJQ58_08455 [Synergistaceae bacterium]|nr:hypothetical protein [Synergistaceae bacterium]